VPVNCTIAIVRMIFLLVLSAPVWAQPLSVYSDLARIDKSGAVTAPENPREILSPMVVRNGFTSFQVVVQTPAGKHWQLHVGQNPENAVAVTMYRESGDTLERVELPVEGESTQIFWMDLWTARDAPVQRIKIEPELNIDGDWVIYPMEGRVMDAVVQGEKPLEPMLPAVDALGLSQCSSDFSGRVPSGPAYTLPAMRSRNGQQDAILARTYAAPDIKRLFKLCEGAPSNDRNWYGQLHDYEPGSPEAYLKIRDYLFRLR
jgi:hypothetical protein